MKTASNEPRMTKIVATIGPASNAAHMIEAIADAGANVFRMNFSHGSHVEHEQVHAMIRSTAKEMGTSIGILADLQGPKLRIGVVPEGERSLEIGDTVVLVSDKALVEGQNILFPHPDALASVEVGHKILVDDGRISFRATRIDPSRVEAEVLNAGVLKDRKGVNFPDTALAVEPITEKDRRDLRLALDLGVDWIAMSFVQTADDVRNLRQLIGGQAKIVAKIEKPVAVQNIDAILEETDAIMVARGDLGVECPWHQLPAIQQKLVEKARQAGKPVIVATQMLESMIAAPLPTRAETSDVANAVMQGADAVMLSAESAAGDYPLEAVKAMSSIIAATEIALSCKPQRIDAHQIDALDDSASIASAAGILARLRKACCITTYTETGATALRVAKGRCHVPILAVCPNQAVSGPLTLVWGVTPIVNSDLVEFQSARKGQIPDSLGQSDLIQPRAPVIVTSGSSHGLAGGTDSLKIAYLES